MIGESFDELKDEGGKEIGTRWLNFYKESGRPIWRQKSTQDTKPVK